jgi:hypothetical protein
MKTLRVLVVLSVAVSLSMLAMGAGKEEKDPWTLRIVPTRSSAKHGTMIDCASKDSRFYVVLTNTSESDLSVWREWCSWGYFCLSFDITLPDGKTIHVKKTPIPWKKNYPDPFVVKPGDHFVYSVRFDGQWTGFSKDWKNQTVKIKAMFKIEKEDDQVDRHKVWTGKIESPEIEATLYKESSNN